MRRHRVIFWSVVLFSLLAACESESPPVLSSSSIDAWSDPDNVYRYLKTPSGECLYKGADCASLQETSVTQFKTVTGFNGIPYGVGKTTKIDINEDGVPDDVVKYSGNLATYTAKHAPSAVRRGYFTYFTYSGEVPLDGFESGNTKIGTTAAIGCDFEGTALFRNADGTAPALGIYASRYNHITGRVAKPVLVHMKCTNDTHDNAAINVDADGYVYLIVSGRADHRGNFIFRSAEPDSLQGFIDFTPPMDDYTVHFNDLAQAAGQGRPFTGVAYRGMNYPKFFWVADPGDERGGYFRLIYTIYCGVIEGAGCTGARQLYAARMYVDGSRASVEGITPLAAFKGHYAVAGATARDIVVAFNVHPANDVDNRTNIYYLHSVDGGETWLNARNEELSLPLVTSAGLTKAAVREYFDPQSEGPIVRRVYLKDIGFQGTGMEKVPTILFVGSVSPDHLPSKTVDHFLASERWTGTVWMQTRLTSAIDHNYSSGMLFPNGDQYRVFYPHAEEPENNALAGGALAYLDTGAKDYMAGLPTLITEPVVDPRSGDSAYLETLCEFNYVKPVLNGSEDFVGILSGGNPYQYRKSAPLFIVDLYGALRRLPTSFSEDEVVKGEVALRLTVSCRENQS